MHHEARDVLPEVLDRLGLERPVLVGHSDGASIALIHAGAGHPVSGLVLLAPHVFVEAVTVAAIGAAAATFGSSGLRERLAPYHDDVDGVFWGWSDVWLSAEFRTWNIESTLPAIDAPVLAIQGDADAYGTLAQLEAIESRIGAPFDRVVVPGGGHVLHTRHGAALVTAIAHFYRSLSPH